jgi:hypothetical protein
MSTLASAATPAGPVIERTLHDIVRLAVSTVEGAEAAGITVVSREGTLETPAHTDRRVVQIDRAQARWHEGPCLLVGTPPGPFIATIHDMAAERRWPHFAAEAARLGVRSMISCSLPLVHGGHRVALNVHGRSASAFDEAATRTAALFAAHSRVAFEQAYLISSLRSALESRQAIGEATGILMERDRVGSAEAFQMLVRSSQRLNVKLRRIAQYVVRTGQSPQTIELDDLMRAGERLT